MSLSALDALRIGRRTQWQAAAFAGVVWALPASLAMVVIAQVAGWSGWWVLLVGAFVFGLVVVRRHTPEAVCVRAIDTGLKLDGAFELAVELECGRQVGARFQGAIQDRVRGALTAAGVRRATWEFAPRFLIASLMISSILVVALGVVRNLQPKTNVADVATHSVAPFDRVELLQALRRAREAGLEMTEEAPGAELVGQIEDDRANAESSLASDARAKELTDARGPNESRAPNAKGEWDSNESLSSDESPNDASVASSVAGPSGALTTVQSDSNALNPRTAPGQAAETGVSGANLATDGPSGVTPEPNAGKLSAPVVPAWWPKRHRAVVEAVLSASP